MYEREDGEYAAGLSCVAEDDFLSQGAGAVFIPLVQPSRVMNVVIFLLLVQHISPLLVF